MAGYYGFSMSNNAVEAYESGEKPKSKWTKREIIEEIKRQIEEEEAELNVSLSDIEKMPLEALMDLALYESSWHHTSGYFNETSFYSVDASEITESDIEDWRPPEKKHRQSGGPRLITPNGRGVGSLVNGLKLKNGVLLRATGFTPITGVKKNIYMAIGLKFLSTRGKKRFSCVPETILDFCIKS